MSSLGHSMLLFAGGDLESPMTYNWGAFDGAREGLLSDFVRGELPYFLAEWPWPLVREDLLGQGRGAVGQRLALSEAEATHLLEQLSSEDAPDRSGYLYDWETANCSTKARDAIDEASRGALRASLQHPVDTTARDDIRRHIARFFAQDLVWSFVAGPVVDEPLTAWERTLFPERLADAVALATRDGQPLARETCVLLPGRFGWAPALAAPSWTWGLPGMLAGWLSLAALGGRGPSAQRLLATASGLYGVFLTILGTVTLALWAVTAMKGAGPTAGWLLAGPQSVVLPIAAVAVWRHRRPSPLVRGLVAATAALALVGSWFVTDGMAMALLPGVLACAVALWRGAAPQSQM